MDYEVKDCIDAGSEFCPCHLAETGDCILCSQLNGKKFCDCINWKGVCIYQEYILNGNHAKQGRKNYLCKVMKREVFEDIVFIYTLNVPHNLVHDLIYPGSFIFVRDAKSEFFYDTPISILDTNTEDNTIKFAIEAKGVKTKTICNLQEDDKILIRGPFWNGVLGLKNVEKTKDSVCLLISRGIGNAPAIPVLKKLYANGNRVISIIDSTPYNKVLCKEYFDMCNSETIPCEMLKLGELSDAFKELLLDVLENEEVSLIHCDGPDILIYKTLNFLENFKNINFSCCNNAKMCCGEGVCGTCSVRYKNHVVKRLCKFQIDPKYIFRGRRLI